MLKQIIIAGVMLSLSISSVQAIASFQNEFVLCPPTAQCVDNMPAHCTVGSSWELVGSNKVKAGIYALRAAWQNIGNTGSTCLYSIIENDYSNPGLFFSRNDLRNVLPVPGNFWHSTGGNTFLCIKQGPAFVLPSDCPFVEK